MTFLEQTPIGKVDEVLGPINQVYFTIKPQEGIVATSFKPGDRVFIGGDKLLPLEKYVEGNLFFFFFFLRSSRHVAYHEHLDFCQNLNLHQV